MQSFEFKPALMRGRTHWTLDSGQVTKNGEPFCSLDRVTGARFAQMTVKRSHSEWFELVIPGGHHRITCNMYPGDESNLQFRALCAAVLDDLARRKPDMQVAIGAGGGIRWAMFIIGLVAGLFGLAVMLLTATGAVRESKALFAILFGLGFAAFGAFIGWSYRPWAPPELISVADARDMLSELAAHGDPSSAEQDG